jgi:hypothetical protein
VMRQDRRRNKKGGEHYAQNEQQVFHFLSLLQIATQAGHTIPGTTSLGK